MLPVTFYPAFIGMFFSVVGLTYLAWKEHNPERPRTLSEIASEKQQILNYFRIVIWVCATLFAITVYFYIDRRITHSSYVIAAWTLTYLGDVLLGIFPARESIELFLHNVFSYGMAIGMVLLACVFAFSLNGNYARFEIVIVALMLVLAVLALSNRKRFLYYELPFIFLSHTTILIAALALR